MDFSLVTLWLATQNWKLVAGMSVFFMLVLIWASRYPGTLEEAERRIANGEKLGWLK
jgi:hypothetical protein